MAESSIHTYTFSKDVSSLDKSQRDKIIRRVKYLCHSGEWCVLKYFIPLHPWVITTPFVLANGMVTSILHQVIASETGTQASRVALISAVLDLDSKATMLNDGNHKLPLDILCDGNVKIYAGTRKRLITTLVDAYTAACQPVSKEEQNMCCICQDKTGAEELARIYCCVHTFCFTCIESWAEQTNTCPLCQTRFHKIVRDLPRKDSKNLLQVNHKDIIDNDSDRESETEEESGS